MLCYVPLLYTHSQSASLKRSMRRGGLKGDKRQLQSGGFGAATTNTVGGTTFASSGSMGVSTSINTINGVKQVVGATGNKVTGMGLTVGTSYGSSFASSPTQGSAASMAIGNGGSNATSLLSGGDTTNTGTMVAKLNVNSFGQFATGGAGMASFGTPVAIPGVAGAAPYYIQGQPTGGVGGGFGMTYSGTFGNATGDLVSVSGNGFSNANGYGSGTATSVFGSAGGGGGGSSDGAGSGSLDPTSLTVPVFGITSFNGTSGGLANGLAGGFVGFNPPTPDFTFIPLGP
jgi:hypothetical protein